ncbi:MAG: sigma-70 family RNA polymerase sigma factor [candidate division Zixibacteria bacterium]|nr:sigma-70 family RNA polymerase sigma factor [candidate division Zixibacteria bacterium]MDH3936371.1 sigma-70 family RNA polymerase sigma factor [candidate division Zixibacteria bacterium]MDH4032202.1 sigma-70 family RNA polymerase sigma factor [candidate division Zixibacteria bacterium]
MNEKQLVAQAKAGDFDAFAKLIEANKQKVFALIRRLAGNNEDAEDILQESFLKAIDKIDQFRQESTFGTWLSSIALNQARALHAKSKQADLKPIEEYLPGGSTHGDGHHDSLRLFDWKDPHQLMESREIKQLVDDAVAALPYKYREAFLLRYVEELSVKEVAGLTNQSVASAKSRILRARLALRETLSSEFEDRYGKKVS